MPETLPEAHQRLITVTSYTDFFPILYQCLERILPDCHGLDLQLLLQDQSDPPVCIVLDQQSLRHDHYFRPCPVPPPLASMAFGQGGPRWTAAPLPALIDGHIDDADRLPKLVTPLESAGRRLGYLLVRASSGDLSHRQPQALERLGEVAGLAGLVLPRLRISEELALRDHQIQALHEAMLMPATALDRASLLSEFIAVLNRQFNLTRVLVATVHQKTGALRSELHTGFGEEIVPFSVALDQRDHYLIRVMEGDTVHIGERERGTLPEHLPLAGMSTRPERTLLIPLRIGNRAMGLIYADQIEHDGSGIFPEVMRLFGRLAAVALENYSLRARAEHHAETDALTGLYNRYFLDKMLKIEIPRVKRYNHTISLLMIDLCDFKRINDTHGHAFGDFILREAAGLLRNHVRRPDIVVRLGGDEFVVLMVNTNYDQARLVRDRIEKAFIERNRLQTDPSMLIYISLGLRSADAENIEDLIHEADMAMYEHKARQTRVSLLKALIEGNPEKIEAADRVVGSLCNILFKKVPNYFEHARRVTHLALRMGAHLGIAPADLEMLALAALLHDVGKVAMPTEILQKAETLSPSEIEALRHHPALGEEFFEGIEHLAPVRMLIRSHHERFDGRLDGAFPGYPDGLIGEHILLGARILKLAESADTMISGQTYQAPMPLETVEEIIREESGKSFDPRLVRVLLADRHWGDNLGDIDSIVRLLAFEDTLGNTPV